MKKIGVFFSIALSIMVVIGLILHFVSDSDITSFLITAGSMFSPLVAVLVTRWLFKEPLFAGLGININFNRWWVIGWLLMPILSLAILGMSLLIPGVHLSTEVLDEVMKDAPVKFGLWGFVVITFLSGLMGGATVNAVLAFGEEFESCSGGESLMDKILEIGSTNI